MVLRRRGFFQPHPRLLATATDRRGLSVGLGSANVPVMTGYPKMAMMNNILALAINVVANLVLIPRMGIMGAAVGSLIALGVLAVARLLEVLVIHRLHPFAVHQLKPLVAGLGALVVGMALNRVIYNWHTIIVLLVAGVVFTGVYFSVLYGPETRTGRPGGTTVFQRKFKRWRS